MIYGQEAMKTIKEQCDVLIIGAGAAGLRAACAAAEMGVSVRVVSEGACASPEIMGFNAVVETEDSAECFYQDLYAAGCEISDVSLARTLAEGSRKEISFLERLGLDFDRKRDGSYHTLHTLGCTYPRLVHIGAVTGSRAMAKMKSFCREQGVEFQENVRITDLVLCERSVAGAVGICMETESFIEYGCKAVVLATGGAGALHRITTYPASCAGDGYMLAFRAGAELIDMEFQQFEPCSFVYPKALQGKIVPTTLLRSGAKLLNGLGEEFMERYGLTRENARKGALSKAIAAEIQRGSCTPHGGVYYDMTMLPAELIIEGHSIFYKPAKAAGLDITKVPAEMAPAGHTYLGGVRIDAAGATSVPGLFAAGEVTGGVHGADRIGGCAGAETLVFGRLAGETAGKYASGCTDRRPLSTERQRKEFEDLSKRKTGISAAKLRGRLEEVMTRYVGILRDEQGLKTALEKVRKISGEIENASGGEEGAAGLYRLRNMALLAEIQIQASLLRQESRGVFSRTDFPRQDDGKWRKNLVFWQENGELLHREKA